MPTPVTAPPLIFLSEYRVGAPVAHAQAAATRQSLAHLVGHNVHCVAALCGLPSATGLTIALPVVVSPSAVALRVVIELNKAAAAGASCTVTATLTAPPAIVGDGVTTATDFADAPTTYIDGSQTLECPTAADRVPGEYERVFDVSALDSDTVHTLTVTTATVAGSPLGVWKISAYEIPRSVLYPESAP
jgi:hypothetical protein